MSGLGFALWIATMLTWLAAVVCGLLVLLILLVRWVRREFQEAGLVAPRKKAKPRKSVAKKTPPAAKPKPRPVSRRGKAAIH